MMRAPYIHGERFGTFKSLRLPFSQVANLDDSQLNPIPISRTIQTTSSGQFEYIVPLNRRAIIRSAFARLARITAAVAGGGTLRAQIYVIPATALSPAIISSPPSSQVYLQRQLVIATHVSTSQGSVADDRSDANIDLFSGDKVLGAFIDNILDGIVFAALGFVGVEYDAISALRGQS